MVCLLVSLYLSFYGTEMFGEQYIIIATFTNIQFALNEQKINVKIKNLIKWAEVILRLCCAVSIFFLLAKENKYQ